MLVIIGESGSGKSSLAKALSDKHKNYKRIVTYTTRPRRDNEVDGIDYHFIDQARFDELVEQDFFVEYNMYREWCYGTALQDCSNDNNVIAVLTPAGYRALKRAGVKARSIYLYVDRRSRLINILKRGDNIEEAYRRSLSDVGQFDGLVDEADYIIDNTGFHLPVKDVLVCLEAIIKAIKDEETENGD